MDEPIQEFVQKLQEQIYEETREAYGEETYRRWQNPLYSGSLEDPDGYARLKGTCGDTMEIFLKFDNDTVRKASYRTDGCGSSAVCGSFAAEMSLGKNPDELLDVTGEAILERLGGFPEEERHCAFLAAETLQEALHDYMMRQREEKKR